jgi:hypothetical protein
LKHHFLHRTAVAFWVVQEAENEFTRTGDPLPQPLQNRILRRLEGRK